MALIIARHISDAEADRGLSDSASESENTPRTPRTPRTQVAKMVHDLHATPSSQEKSMAVDKDTNYNPNRNPKKRFSRKALQQEIDSLRENISATKEEKIELEKKVLFLQQDVSKLRVSCF